MEVNGLTCRLFYWLLDKYRGSRLGVLVSDWQTMSHERWLYHYFPLLLSAKRDTEIGLEIATEKVKRQRELEARPWYQLELQFKRIGVACTEAMKAIIEVARKAGLI